MWTLNVPESGLTVILSLPSPVFSVRELVGAVKDVASNVGTASVLRMRSVPGEISSSTTLSAEALSVKDLAAAMEKSLTGSRLRYSIVRWMPPWATVMPPSLPLS